MTENIQQKIIIKDLTNCFFDLKRKLLNNMAKKISVLFLTLFPLTESLGRDGYPDLAGNEYASEYDWVNKIIGEERNTSFDIYNNKVLHDDDSNRESIFSDIPFLFLGACAFYLGKNCPSYMVKLYNYFYPSYGYKGGAKKLAINIDNLNKCREKSQKLSLQLNVLSEEVKCLWINENNKTYNDTTPNTDLMALKTIPEDELKRLKGNLEDTKSIIWDVLGVFEDSFSKIEIAAVEDIAKKENIDKKRYYQSIIEAKLPGEEAIRVLSADGVREVLMGMHKALTILENITGIFFLPTRCEEFPEAAPFVRACCEEGAGIFNSIYQEWQDLKDKMEKFADINKHLQDICEEEPVVEENLVKMPS